MEKFAADYSGTAASFEALHELALMEIHARQMPDAGLARMKIIHTAVQAYKGPAPEGLRLDLKRYTFVFAIALADAEQFGQAEALLHPVAAGKDADAAQAKQILARIKVQKTLLVGLQMPKFSGKQLRDGETLKIDDLKGKVVLVQFWATWSRPCDQEMPEVAKVYQELHLQGFEIVGVSLDDDRRDCHTRLLSYLKEKNMPWPQLYDGKGWKSALADQFFIRSIPTSFLLDKNGVIRASNLRSRELKAAVLPLL
jgi:peroxiredoxin